MEKQAVEFDIFAFVKMRYRELGIIKDPSKLFDQGKALRVKMARHKANRFYAASLGGIAGFIGLGVLANDMRSLSLNASTVASCAVLAAAAGWACRFWFHDESARRFPKITTEHPPYEIESASDLAKVLEPVIAGRAQLALISVSGEAKVFTPASNRPIEKFISGKALFDAWLPGDLFHHYDEESSREGQKGTSEHVVILWQEVTKKSRKSPEKIWKNYYLWRLQSEYVATAFDRAVTIYQDERVKRMKARFAVLYVCDYFSSYAVEGKAIPSQTVLTNSFKQHLKAKANMLRSTGEFDDFEARQFEQMGISGKPKEADPAEFHYEQNDGSDGWFEQLLSGINNQISPALRVEVLKDFPTLEMFRGE
jgi:hypothetical protein